MGSRWNRKAEKSTGFEIPEAATYGARCVALIALGTHQDVYKDKETENELIYLAWELIGETDTKGSPFVVYAKFNQFISSTSKFGKFLAAWRGKPIVEGDDIDLTKLLSAPCALNLGHKTSKGKNGKDRVDVEILTIAPPQKGSKLESPSLTPIMWDHEMGAFSEPDWLPRCYGQKVADVIAESLESRGHGSDKATAAAAKPGGKSVATRPSTANFADPDAGREAGSDDDAGDDDIPF